CGCLLAIARSTAPAGAVGPVAAATGTPGGLGGLFASEFLLGHVALVDPHLHADAAEGGVGFEESLVDVRPEGVQGHTTFPVELPPAHLPSAPTAGALNLHAPRAGARRGLHALAPGAAEGDARGEPLGDALGNVRRVEFGVPACEDGELALLAGELRELLAQSVSFRSATPDDDPGASGVQVDVDPIAGAFDLYLGDAGPFELVGDQLADLHVLLDVVAVTLPFTGGVREPTGAVVDRKSVG